MSDDSVNHYSILIISKNSSGTSELDLQLTEKGYKTFNAPPFADLKYLDTGHLVLIVIVDCPDTSVSITEHLHLNCGISGIPIIYISDRFCSEKPSNLEQIVTEVFLSKSAAFDALESRIRFCLHNKHTLRAESLPEPAFHDRRKPVTLTEKTQATHQESGITLSSLADATRAQENNDSINLLVISQREHLFSKLLTHFSETPAISIAKECFNSLELMEQLQPDLLLVDTALSGPAVTEWLHAIRKKDAKVKIILLCNDVIPDLINEIVEFGISGLIKINASRDIYKKAIRTVHSGELWLPHHMISRIIATFSTQGPPPSRNTLVDLPKIISTSVLTQRELYIVELVAQGLTNKQIAKQLNISPETIKKKLTNLFYKSDVHSRSQLVSIYAESLKGSPSKNPGMK